MKIFSKLRRAFIEQRKLTKYLTYALGEIILVVLGILIALQINNANEEKKSAEAEKRLLMDLNTEFKENLKELEIDLKRLEESRKSTGILLGLMTQQQVEIEGFVLDTLLSSHLTQPTWDISVFMLEELKNSGGFGKIKNQKLKNALLDWERFYSNVEEIEKDFNRSFIEQVQFLKENSSLREIDQHNPAWDLGPSILPNRNKDLLKDYKFENYLDDFYIVSSDLLNSYYTAQKKLKVIIEESDGG